MSEEIKRKDYVSAEFGWWDASDFQEILPKMQEEIGKLRSISPLTGFVGRREIKVLGLREGLQYDVIDYAWNENLREWEHAGSRTYTPKDLR
jgi:hypothetical protein